MLIEDGTLMLIWFYLNRVLPGTGLNDEWTAYKTETTSQAVRLTKAKALRDAGLVSGLLLGTHKEHVIAFSQVLVNDAQARVDLDNGSFPSYTEVA